MNVSLSDELETVIEEKIKSGFYNSASEVVRDFYENTIESELPPIHWKKAETDY